MYEILILNNVNGKDEVLLFIYVILRALSQFDLKSFIFDWD